jgi:hypothetical protein
MHPGKKAGAFLNYSGFPGNMQDIRMFAYEYYYEVKSAETPSLRNLIHSTCCDEDPILYGRHIKNSWLLQSRHLKAIWPLPRCRSP